MAGFLRRRPLGRLAGVIACALCAVGAPTLSYGEDWPTYQHDAQHSGRSTSSLDPRDLNLAWSAPSGFHRAVIFGDRVFTTTRDGESMAFDLDTGEVEWSHAEDIYYASAATYAEGRLFYTGWTPEGYWLIVLNAGTGDVIYRVDTTIDLSAIQLTPTVARNPQTELVAYLAGHDEVEAIQLGPSGGTSLWTGTGMFGGISTPTIAEESLILAGYAQYYAFDIHTGERNHFHQTSFSGSSGNTAAYDESRKQFYIMGGFAGTTLLSAYELIDNDNISLLWQQSGPGVVLNNAVALDSEGYVYSCDSSTLVVRDPETGIVTDSALGSFALGMAPILSYEYIWTFSASETNVYDRSSLEWVTSLPGTRGHLNSPWKSIGAISDTHFVMDNHLTSHGFDVFRVTPPCPADLNLDGVVNSTDLGIILNEWGLCPDACDPGDPANTCAADLTGDCRVKALDLAILLGSWGPCP